MQTASVQTAPVQTSPVQTASIEIAPVRAGVLGQAALALADGFARILMEKGLMTRAEYMRGFDLAIQAWAEAEGHPQQHDVLSALRKIRPQE